MNLKVKNVGLAILILFIFNTLLPSLQQVEKDICVMLYRFNRYVEDFSQVDAIKDTLDTCIAVMHVKIDETEFKLQEVTKKMNAAIKINVAWVGISVLSWFGMDAMNNTHIKAVSVLLRNGVVVLMQMFGGISLYHAFTQKQALVEALKQDRVILAKLETVKDQQEC